LRRIRLAATNCSGTIPKAALKRMAGRRVREADGGELALGFGQDFVVERRPRQARLSIL
jgi:hypothetical protein